MFGNGIMNALKGAQKNFMPQPGVLNAAQGQASPKTLPNKFGSRPGFVPPPSYKGYGFPGGQQQQGMFNPPKMPWEGRGRFMGGEQNMYSPPQMPWEGGGRPMQGGYDGQQQGNPALMQHAQDYMNDPQYQQEFNQWMQSRKRGPSQNSNMSPLAALEYTGNPNRQLVY